MAMPASPCCCGQVSPQDLACLSSSPYLFHCRSVQSKRMEEGKDDPEVFPHLSFFASETPASQARRSMLT